MSVDLTKKQCSKCKIWRGRIQFHKANAAKDGLASSCRDCRRIVCHASYEATKNTTRKMWADANRKQILEGHKRYRRENPEKVKAGVKHWRSRNPDRVRAWVIKRERMEVKQYVEDIDRELVWNLAGGVCILCGNPADKDAWHLDHLLPLSRGGKHAYDNVGVSHPKCNLQKGTKTLDEWRQQS